MSDVWHDEQHTRERWLIFVQPKRLVGVQKPFKMEVVFNEQKAIATCEEMQAHYDSLEPRYYSEVLMIHQKIISTPTEWR